MEESGLLPVYAALLAHRISPARFCIQETCALVDEPL